LQEVAVAYGRGRACAVTKKSARLSEDFSGTGTDQMVLIPGCLQPATEGSVEGWQDSRNVEMTGKPSYETLREEIMITLNTVFPVMKRLFGIRSIGIFGQIAHGEDPPGGVIELLVEFAPATESYRVYAGLCAYLEEKFDRKVRLVTTRMLTAPSPPPEIPDLALPPDTPGLLRQILDGCVAIQEQKKDVSYSAFTRSEQMKCSMSRSLQQIGGAAAGIPEDFRRLHPDVSWGDLISLQDHLIRNPFGVDGVLLWSAAGDLIPATERKMQDILNQQ
jgi:uncharacterized protein